MHIFILAFDTTPFIHSSSLLLNTYSVPGIVLCAGQTALTMPDNPLYEKDVY